MNHFQVAIRLGLNTKDFQPWMYELKPGLAPNRFIVVFNPNTPDQIIKKIKGLNGMNWISITE